MDKTESVVLDKLLCEHVSPWSRYTLGVVDQFRRNELPVDGFEAEISGNLPLGAGLSSSASLENATVLFLAKLFGAKLDAMQMARISQKAEHDFVGVRCGLLDQIASLMSKAHNATMIDCRTLEVSHVPLDGKVSVIIANSNVKHALVGGEYNERRSDCEAAAHALGVPFPARCDDRDVEGAQERDGRPHFPPRAAHHGRERARAGGLGRAAPGRYRALRRADVCLARELDTRNFENSCPELDRLVEAARKTPGVYGARISGGGFGGATINLVEKGREEEVVKALTAALPEVTCLVTDGVRWRDRVRGEPPLTLFDRN